MSSLMTYFQQYLPATGIILLPNLGGIMSGLISNTNDNVRGWYRTLKRPALAPPNWVFGPVWTSIYACMGVSSYLIFKEGGFAAQALPLSVFGAQLFFNWIWSPLFFRLRRMDLAMVDIIALWASIAATMVVFYPVNQTAALLLLPHFGWVSFASFLNYSFLRLNRKENQAITDKDK